MLNLGNIVSSVQEFQLNIAEILYGSVIEKLTLHEQDFIYVFTQLLETKLPNTEEIERSNTARKLFEFYLENILIEGNTVRVRNKKHSTTGYVTLEVAEIYELGTELIPPTHIWRSLKELKKSMKIQEQEKNLKQILDSELSYP